MDYLMFLDDCEGIGPIVGVAKKAINIIRIAAPIALIAWGSFDMLKAIIAGDDKKVAAARKPLFQRFLSAVIIFLIPTVFEAIITLITAQGNSTGTKWIDCWNNGDTSFSGIEDPLN